MRKTKAFVRGLICLLLAVLLNFTSAYSPIVVETKASGVMKASNDTGEKKYTRFIIKYKNEKYDKEVLSQLKDKVKSSKKIKSKGLDIITSKENLNPKDLISELKLKKIDSLIEYIQPDYKLTLSSNDPYFSSQWGLESTVSGEIYSDSADIENAWEESQGEGVTVGVIDTAIDINHEDLKENIWVNTGEIPGNGIDDDGNGYVDDVTGWNFSEDNNVVNTGDMDHGTHIAGIIAAVKDNGKGIAGVAPKAKVMPLKVFSNGQAYTSDIVEAIEYAEKMGVKVINGSWGSSDENQALKEAIEGSSMLFVCAAGNSGINIDESPVYPASYTSDNVIAVASVGTNGNLASDSNYGANTVDVAAPGVKIIGTLPGNIYGEKSGTSMATAYISGVIALLGLQNTTGSGEFDNNNILKKIKNNFIGCIVDRPKLIELIEKKQASTINERDAVSQSVYQNVYDNKSLYSLYGNESLNYTDYQMFPNLFPQPVVNEQFSIKGNGVINTNLCKMYKYDYSQNLTWTPHGFNISVDTDKEYTYSFDAYISPDANISGTGTTWIANGENGFGCNFSYDNTKKGTWQHFEYTARPTSTTAVILLYPTAGTIPATTGYILYGNVEFKQSGTVKNLFPQPEDNKGFGVAGNGIIQWDYSYSDANCMYKYNYSQNLTWAPHGFEILVDTNKEYIYSFDAYISPDANISSTGTTWIANGENGFGCNFSYDNTKKGTWQHFEYTARPTSTTAVILLYPTAGTIPATTGYILYKNVEFRQAGQVSNLFPQAAENDGFHVKGAGVFEVKRYQTYSYDYSQNLTWTPHGFNISVGTDKEYTYSFDAYISPDANISGTGTTWIANGENGFGCNFSYDNTKKGTWQHFEYTARPTSTTAIILLYPTAGTIPATTGYVLYRNVEFRQSGTTANLFPQPAVNGQFSIKGNGVINTNLCKTYKYNYSQNLTWTPHGFNISVDTDKEYTYSFDAYISPDANISGTGTTWIANGENGFGCNFSYDNTKKGTWQHFEYIAKPTSTTAVILLYPTAGTIPATTGYILYGNVEFKQSGTVKNLFPQPEDNKGFGVAGNGIIQWDYSYSDANCMYKYNYSQNLTWTPHGFEILVDTNKEYIYSFDAYISPDANISSTGTTWIANGENGFGCNFSYDNTKKGTWQHFEYTARPTSTTAVILLYPTAGTIPATTGYILYKNVEFRQAGQVSNLFPQAAENDGFHVKGAGVFEVKRYQTYSYDYSQNLTWTPHGFNISVGTDKEYTYSFDAYISPDANISGTGTTWIANGENGFGCNFSYDNTKKGTWQHFEYTARPTSTTAIILLYPTVGDVPATTGYVLYRNVEFKSKGVEWSKELDTGSEVQYIYNSNNILTEIHAKGCPIVRFFYDANGRLLKKEML